jgi:AmmeMemoRadiSam system protein A
LHAEQRQALLAVARRSIALGLAEGRPLRVNLEDYAAELRAQRAAFVTLQEFGQLRGCIGHLEARQPLVKDVAENAFAAAFRDPRFPPVTARELERLHIEISVLTPATPLSLRFRAGTGRPDRAGPGWPHSRGGPRPRNLPALRLGVLCPTRWTFSDNLKRKAGLPENYWSDRLRISRYRTESFGEKNLSS